MANIEQMFAAKPRGGARSATRRVLGIDPGVSITGYGVVESAGGDSVALGYGVIRTARDDAIGARLDLIAAQLEEVIAATEPHCVAIERVLFQSNVRTAISVGQASGVALLVAARAGLDTYFYSPNEVKQAVAGYGAADKRQVSAMIQRILALEAVPKPADAADALAIALTHLSSSRIRAQVAEASA